MTTILRETSARDPLVLVSTWRAHPGHEADLEQRLTDELDAVLLHEAGVPDYHLVHRFADRGAMRRWLDSADRDALHDELAGIAERVGEPERLSGLEPWFTAVGKPPKWKMWLASFVGAYPLVVLFQWLAAPHVEHLPLLLRAALLPLVLLSLMTYVMMPVVTRVLGGWLAR
ncbi:hypothetical protein OJ997_03570 [Solirubrobacter phytolaccae]|uniref:Antibiotic biosynthesis monooxygenase n=1 Tax=Solirubrobacter phytolaccae TaxID=1404360 RepID=A0A9X3N3V0_9ACTN|nr:hypothetical protein [Solirubrobacter phytolaccae]MDA0179365.1 hypothetical protein [Solirubrobacter phytolaccae]